MKICHQYDFAASPGDLIQWPPALSVLSEATPPVPTTRSLLENRPREGPGDAAKSYLVLAQRHRSCLYPLSTPECMPPHSLPSLICAYGA